jgi:uncharacterized protein (DUF2252 family)
MINMNDSSEQLLSAIHEIRDLIRLMAEPQIAARDQKLRDELIRIVGRSVPKQKSALLMDGTRSQKDIHKETGINIGHLSTLVKQLGTNKLLVGDAKKPNLAISIPSNFFENRNGV